METSFQTSFIPKQPLVQEVKTAPVSSGRGSGILGLIAWLLFIASLLATGGAYLYKNYLNTERASTLASLERERQNFEPELIADMQRLDARINATEQLLSKHVIMAPIFEVLQSVTLETIRFTEFSYEIDETTGLLNVSMSGEANNYSAIALQAEGLGKNQIIKNPVFSNLALDSTKGMVTFDLDFSVDNNYLLYQNVLVREAARTQAQPVEQAPQ